MGLNFFQKNKKLIVAAVLVAVVFSTTIGPIGVHLVYAGLPPWLLAAFGNPYAAVGSLVGNGIINGKIDGAAGFSCILSITGFTQCLAGALGIIIEEVILPIGAFILWASAGILEFSISYSLDTAWFKDMTAIKEGWKLIRDLVNMGFIFILLYIAISTILQSSSYNIRSMLVKLIIAAVLINFSLFLTQVVMDAGNIVAGNFWDAVTNNRTTSLSKQFINLSKLEGTYGITAGSSQKIDLLTGKPVATQLTGSALLINQTLRLILICIAIYVFFSAAFLFIGRIIGFIFLMLFSPIGFIGAVFPGASGKAAEWRNMLFHQTLVAPVFLIFIYLVMKIMAMLNIPTDTPTGDTIPIGFYFNYIIIMGLLLMALKITKSLSGEMGAMVEKFGKKALAIAGGATLAVATGGAAVAGRAVIGRAAAGVAASETGLGGKLKGMASSERKGILGATERFIGRRGVRATNRVAESSFDVRTGKLFQKGAGALGLAAGAETLGFTLKKKSAIAEAKKEEQKKKETVGGYERQRGEKVKAEQEESRKTAAMLLPDKQRIERKAGLTTAKAAVAEMEERAKQRKAANNTPDAILANQKENDIKTAETAKTTAEQSIAREKAAEEKAQAELAQAQRDKAAGIVGADVREQTAKTEIARSLSAQSSFNTAVQTHTKNITTLTQDLKTANEDILKAVSGGAAQLANLQKAVTDAQAEADRQIKAANDRIEAFAKGITEDRPTYNVVRGAGGVAKGAAVGAAVGSVVPVVGTAIGAGVGATVSTIGAVRGRMTAEESQAVADYIRALHNTQGGSRLKIKPGGGKKEKTLLEHIADISGSDLADMLKDLSPEDQEKMKKALGI